METDYIRYEIEKPIVVSSLVTIHYFEFNDAYVDVEESHEFWELVYVDCGRLGITADDVHFLLEQGELYFYKPYERHRIDIPHGISANLFIISFYSDSPAMHYFRDRRIQADLTQKQYISTIIYEAQKVFDLPFNDPSMKRLIPRETCLFGGAQSIVLRLELLLIEFVRNGNSSLTAKEYLSGSLISDPVIGRVIAYMESRLYDTMTVDDLCTALSFSKSYLSKRFTKMTNCSIMKYYMLLKIREAKLLIRESDKNFTEIAQALHFPNSHYFSNVFGKLTGMTPKEYRKSVKDAGNKILKS